MPPPSPAATAVARRLLARAAAPASDGSETSGASHDPLDDRVAVAVLALARVAEILARWFGPHGYHALLTRALAQARAAHPALAAVRICAPLTPLLDGLPEAAQAHGASVVTAGVAAVIAGVVDLLGRVIGDDMARHLLEAPMDRATPNGPPPSTTPALSAPADAASDTTVPRPEAAR